MPSSPNLRAPRIQADLRVLATDGREKCGLVQPPVGTRAARTHKPHQYADGISMVMVNGVTVFENGAMNGARPGVVLYGPAFRSDQRSDV